MFASNIYVEVCEYDYDAYGSWEMRQLKSCLGLMVLWEHFDAS